MAIESVRSLNTHGETGEYGILINIAHEGPEASESRLNGITKIEVTCANYVSLCLLEDPKDAVESISGVINRDVTGNVTTVSAEGSLLTIELTPPPDEDCYTFTLSPSIISGDRTFRIRALEADCAMGGDEWVGDGVVWPNDRNVIAAWYGATVTDDNCQYDLTCDGNIWPNDRNSVPPRYGNSAECE